MIWISGDRGSGKTHSLATLCVNDPQGIMVVHNNVMAQIVKKNFPALAKRVLVYDMSKGSYNLRGLENLYIDEMGLCGINLMAAPWLAGKIRAAS